MTGSPNSNGFAANRSFAPLVRHAIEAEDSSTRVMLYSHDSWGLGHLRRSLAIAKAITQSFPNASVLVVTGSPCATQFRTPDRVDIVKLPSVGKNSDGQYVARSLSHSLAAVTELRSRLLLTAFRSFRPHVVLVDHQVVGMNGEAQEMLLEARQLGTKTIFGIRDVVDAPGVVDAAWSSDICQWALNKAYDRILVYGSAKVFDARNEYATLRRIADRVEYTGYLVNAEIGRSLPPVPCVRPQVLVTVGGGEDGIEMVEAYLAATELAKNEWRSVILTGPMMESSNVRQLKRRARACPDIEIHRFHADVPNLIHNADAVVSMAGYNSCAEILASGRPAVLLPRTFPRQEQRIRAERLAKCKLAYALIDPTPEKLHSQLLSALSQPPLLNGLRPPLDGLDYVCKVIRELTPSLTRRHEYSTFPEMTQLRP